MSLFIRSGMFYFDGLFPRRRAPSTLEACSILTANIAGSDHPVRVVSWRRESAAPPSVSHIYSLSITILNDLSINIFNDLSTHKSGSITYLSYIHPPYRLSLLRGSPLPPIPSSTHDPPVQGEQYGSRALKKTCPSHVRHVLIVPRRDMADL